MPFVEDQIAAWAALCGERIDDWWGVEMALYEDPGGQPHFEADAVPFLQFSVLDQYLDGGGRRRVGTYQSDDVWGLSFDPPTTHLPASEGIFRLRRAAQLPCGRVDRVEVALDDPAGDIAEVRLELSGGEVLLVAGEVYEDRDRPLRIVRGDESVLVFTDPALVETVAWIPERRIGPPRRFEGLSA